MTIVQQSISNGYKIYRDQKNIKVLFNLQKAKSINVLYRPKMTMFSEFRGVILLEIIQTPSVNKSLMQN